MDKIPIFMAVTKDKYELPVAVADTQWDLARMLGVSEGAISKGIRYADRHGGRKSRYHKVWIDLTPEEYAEHLAIVTDARRKAGLA